MARGRMVRVGDATFRPQGVEGMNLIVRRDHILCTVCYAIEPINCGESGTPMPALLIAYRGAIRRHPPEKHEKPFGT